MKERCIPGKAAVTEGRKASTSTSIPSRAGGFPTTPAITVATEGIVPPLTIVIFDYLAWINLALGIFNLLPGFPLDGGRVFRAFWWWKSGSLVRATKTASDIGKVSPWP